MRFSIVLSPEAVQDLRRLKPSHLSAVKQAIETHLSRSKRLRGIQRPEYRLRVGEVRVFYDVSRSSVEILAIIPKSKTAAWLRSIEESQ